MGEGTTYLDWMSGALDFGSLTPLPVPDLAGGRRGRDPDDRP